MAYRSQFPFLVTALLLQGCAASMGVEPTDLSGIGEGKTRAEVEAIIGTPIEQETLSFGTAAVYAYDRGSSGVLPKDYGGCVGACAMAYMVILPLSILAHDEVVAKQRGHLIVVYDRLDHVLDLYPDQSIDRLKSAHEGDAEAQYELSKAFARIGQIGERFRWLCIAANQNHSKAQSALGDGFRDGSFSKDQTPDHPRAYMWYVLSAANGNRYATIWRDILAAKMGPNELADGERLMAEWKPAPEKCDAVASML